ncbi:uncharacterized protein LOC130432993 isoform X2 [Triplophysa dalaica]|uniref:uncharacterized protein LOC130432993 isoform X2 n=1 Tax=Triplophysa dalaica TaxID=1582913 RepID=UPI0024E01DCC|nr:uncharacterized protein LOC130432993 isoform X2 [Triplophysa dalaica]
MGFLQHSYLQLLNLLIAALSECKAETRTSCVTSGSITYIHVQGDNVSISCLNTTRNSNTFRLKLRRTNKDTDILSYPNISSYHQRWSFTNNTGNVTVDLKDIVVLDAGQYECEVQMNSECITTQFYLKVKECKVLKPVWTTPKSEIMLPCPELLNVKWEVLHGDKSTEITKYECKHTEKTEGATKPLCERSKIVKTSMIIRDVVNSDALWYRCRGNKTCYDVKLNVKDYETSCVTLSTALSTTDKPDPTVSNVGQMEDSRSSTATVASVLSVCIVASLIICVILYLKIRKSKTTSQIEFRRNSLYFARESVYYSQISEVGQTEAAAYVNDSQSTKKCSS